MSGQQPDPVGTARQLADALNGLSARLDAVKEDSEHRDEMLTRYGHASRRRIWLSFALLTVDIALTVVVSVFAVQAHNASTTANELRTASIAACQAANVTRAQNRQLWDHLLDISAATPPRPGETKTQIAAAQKTAVAFRAYVAHVFHSLPCTSLYKGR